MPRCTFCGREYQIPRGLTEFDIVGTVRHFCSSKCRKNFRLGRDSRRVKWTKTYRIAKGKEKASLEKVEENQEKMPAKEKTPAKK